MRRLIIYELKKHFLTKHLLLLFLLLLGINGWKAYTAAMEQSPFSKLTEDYFQEAYEKLYREYRGELTGEKLSRFRELYSSLNEKVADQTYSTEAEEGSLTFNSFSDFLLLRWCFFRDIEYESGYEAYAADVVANAVKNVDFYQGRGNLYEARMNYRIAKAFHQRKLSEFYNTDGFRGLLYYDFSGIILVLLGVFGCSSVFIREKETEMELLLRTSTNGRTESFLAKLFAGDLFLSGIGLLFSAEDYLVFSAVLGTGEVCESSLYVLEGFQDTLYGGSLLSFYSVCVAGKLLGLLAVGTLCMAVSLIGRSSLQVILVNIGILTGLTGVLSLGGVWNSVNPLLLFFGRRLFMRPSFINLFGYPVMDCVGSYLFAGGLIVAGVLWMMVRWKRGERR